jgi:hypothetical protein
MPADANFRFHPLQELESLLGLLGFVTLVVLPQNLICGRINYYSLHSGRPDIEPYQKLSLLVMSMMRKSSLLDRWCWLRERCNLDQRWPFMIVHEILKNEFVATQFRDFCEI